MPPKKAKTAVTPAAKAPTKKTGRSTTVVSNRGKEYDTTAAAARPRRATTETSSVPLKTADQSTATSAATTKKRGRPAQIADEAVEPPKKRGRPARAAATVEEEEEVESPKRRGRLAKSTSTTSQPPAKKPGRPAKSPTVTSQPSTTKKPDRPAKTTAAAPDAPKKRGRPAKVTSKPVEEVAEQEDDQVQESEDDTAKVEPPKKRGRSAKNQAATAPTEQTAPPAKKRGRQPRASAPPADALAEPDTPPPHKRHSGRFGGPTTKISTDAVDAAEQLEDELIDEAEKSAKKGSKKKSSSSALSQDANGSGKNYWLMKAEQVDRMETLKDGSEFNTKFTIDDLKSKSVPEPWEGVRNMVARNNMRAMKQGDLAFFYASQGKAPGITGIIEVVKEHEPDYTVTDENSIGFVEANKRAKENQWSLVHVEFRKKLSEPVTLKQLQKFSTGNGVLKDMQVIKQSRLSVAKVSEKEWNFIVDNLIEGYEEDDANPKGDAGESNDDHEDDLYSVKVGGDPPLNTNLNGGQVVAGAHVDEAENALPDHATCVDDNYNADEVLTSGTALPPTTQATSRPISRHGSRPASRAGSHAVASRQGSLAPPLLQTTETLLDVAAAEPTFEQSPGSFAPALTLTEDVFEGPAVLEPTLARVGSVKPDGAPRASRSPSAAPPLLTFGPRTSSRAASREPSREPSLAPSFKPFMRSNSLEPSARPGSRGRSKTPNAGTASALPSLA